jgi:hypothetical protein
MWVLCHKVARKQARLLINPDLDFRVTSFDSERRSLTVMMLADSLRAELVAVYASPPNDDV